jgi:hypothetical protein
VRGLLVDEGGGVVGEGARVGSGYAVGGDSRDGRFRSVLSLAKGLRNSFLHSPTLAFLMWVWVLIEETGSES